MEIDGDVFRVTVSGNRPIDEYVLSIIIEFNRGYRVIELRGSEDNICRVADIYVELKRRLGNAVKIIEGYTGTRRDRGRRGRRNYIRLLIGYNPLGWD